MATDTQTEIINVPLEFGNVSIGDNTAGVSVKIDRDRLNINAADDLFCGRRIQARVAAGRPNEDPAQEYLFEDLEWSLEAAFEVKGYSVKPKYIRATLNVCLADIDIDVLGHFAKRQGRMIVTGMVELDSEPEPESEREPGDEDDEN